jgi:hypothetical protein
MKKSINSILTNLSSLGGSIAHVEVPSCPIVLIPPNCTQEEEKTFVHPLGNSKASHVGIKINCLYNSHRRDLPYLQLFTYCTVAERIICAIAHISKMMIVLKLVK